MRTLHDAVFGFFQRIFENWLLGLLARGVFAATLFMFFYESFLGKVGSGTEGLLAVQDSAYFQILGERLGEMLGGDASAIEMWPWGALVHLATYAEIVLPVFILLGFLTRISALGMLIFVCAMSWVNLTGELVPAEMIADKVVRSQPVTAETLIGEGVAEVQPPVEPVEPPAAEPAPAPMLEQAQTLFFLDLGGAAVDQRAMWIFVLVYLILRGPGAVSLDRLFGGRPYDDDEYYEEY
ncbi:hypothetical protein LNKW23_09390 [Paralimibaculum aggregatum]|uniref:DoxX family protein n=1 Tax=Paralimibaculum aggregatum TaxID=3036245 RepID=A0ABQ6LMQ6_9RHOB|nr:DoxX family protein [Limibaculum sp. NKW23]GMG81726.1 hypothetical protein LNKW23_09390 [Limibaculum sp. NKW23]